MGKICEHTKRWYSEGGMTFSFNRSHDAVEVEHNGEVKRISLVDWYDMTKFIDSETK